MTIEEKVSNIILETMKEQTDFCKKTALGNKATLAEQKAILDKAVQSILALIKPMSREDILKAIERVRWTRAAKAFEDTNSRFEYDLADSLLELINGKEA